MLRGATCRAEEIAGTAVLRIVVSNDSMKNATATSQGRRRLDAAEVPGDGGGAINGTDSSACLWEELTRIQYAFRVLRQNESFF